MIKLIILANDKLLAKFIVREYNIDSTQDSPINDAIMDRIVHNSYVVLIEGTISMRERHGLVSRLNAGEAR